MKEERLLDTMGNVRTDFILEAENWKRRRALPAARLLIAAALLLVGVGAAVAARQSHLLEHIFRNSDQPPTPAVEAHLVQLDGEEAAKDVTFRVDEYLLDDDTLYLSWTAENRTGEPLIFFGPFIEGPGEYGFYAGMLRSAVGGEVLGTALPEAYSETSEFHVTGGGEGPVKVTMLAQSPIAPFVDVSTSSPVGTPVIAWRVRDQSVQSFCYGFDTHAAKIVKDGQFVDDDGSDGWGPSTSTSFNYDDREPITEEDFAKGIWWMKEAEADEGLGYAKLAQRWDVDVTLEKGTTRRSPVKELPSFELEDRTVVITEFTQTDVTNRLRFQVVPKREGMFDEGAPEYELYVNGATEGPEGLTGQSVVLNNDWEIDGVTPVNDTPRINAWEFEWLNDGEPIRQIRLELRGDSDGCIDWRL